MDWGFHGDVEVDWGVFHCSSAKRGEFESCGFPIYLSFFFFPMCLFTEKTRENLGN